MIGKAVITSRKTDEWYTPKDFYRELNHNYNFTLDPCATKENAKCDKYFTIADDGLSKSWEGETVFCNPPYSKIKKWVQKAVDESKHAEIVMLIPARTDTRWFHDYIYGKFKIQFLKGRLKFGGSATDAPFPSMLVYFNEVDE